jgi:diketogulonate reductase-like aldo/keto reductase
MMPPDPISRRDMLRLLVAGSSMALLHPDAVLGQTRGQILTRRIPSSREELPLVGLGTWITFNVGDDPVGRAECAEVMRAFFASGGRLIDSSPMYGSAQSVVGDGVAKLTPSRLFSADKVWTGSSEGRAQLAESRRRWRVRNLDLVQVHNLLNWQEHLPMLFEMKAAKQIRYVGITTSEGRRHREIEQIMRTQPLDFVQVTYNIMDREVESRILPLLKFIVSHPAVTCAIPATSRVAHVRENMGASYGRLPDDQMRRRMIAYVEGL